MWQFYVSIILVGLLLIIASLIWVICDKRKSVNYVHEIEEKKAELENTIEDAEEMIIEMNKFYDYLINQIDSRNEQLKNKFKEINMKNNMEDKESNGVKEENDGTAKNMAEIELADEAKNIKDEKNMTEFKPQDEAGLYIDYKTASKEESNKEGTIHEHPQEASVYTIKDVIKNAAKSRPKLMPESAIINTANTVNTVNTDNIENIENIKNTKNTVRAAYGGAYTGNTAYTENVAYTESVANTENIANTANTEAANIARTAQNIIPLNFKQKEVLKLASEGLNETEIAKRMNIGKGEVQLILELNR